MGLAGAARRLIALTCVVGAVSAPPATAAEPILDLETLDGPTPR
jgi:hypothetical protein